MSIKYASDANDFTVGGLNKLFESVGWDARQDLTWKKILEKSGFLVGAFDGECLVGFARTFDDGRMWVMICDVLVHPDYRNRGIATEMMSRVKKWVADKDFRTCRLFADISSDPGLVGFYEKFGFEQMDNAMRLKGLAF